MRRLTNSLLATAVALAVTASASASPIGDTFDFGWDGFISTVAGGFNFEDGEAGEGGGIVGNYTFGTAGTFDLYGNTIVVDSAVEDAGPGAEDWVFTLSAQDGGPIWDPTSPADYTFMAFRQLSFGTRDFSQNPLTGDGILSPTNADPVDDGYLLDVMATISDDSGVLGTRELFSTTRSNGVFIDRTFAGNGPGNDVGDEIRLLGTFDGTLPTATTIEVRHRVSVIPEPTTLVCGLIGGLVFFARPRTR